MNFEQLKNASIKKINKKFGPLNLEIGEIGKPIGELSKKHQKQAINRLGKCCIVSFLLYTLKIKT